MLTHKQTLQKPRHPYECYIHTAHYKSEVLTTSISKQLYLTHDDLWNPQQNCSTKTKNKMVKHTTKTLLVDLFKKKVKSGVDL